MKTIAVLVLAASAAGLSAALPTAAPFGGVAGSPAVPEPRTALHCQVPCGIYGDKLRIDMLMEDAATIEKGMQTIAEMEAGGGLEKNQMVRWVMTKDEHAQHVQEMLASYWLAQRVKAAKEGDAAARGTYLQQLELIHGMTVAAMKCKQTVDTANVDALRKHALAFSKAYFSEEDWKHVQEHHGHAGDEHR